LAGVRPPTIEDPVFFKKLRMGEGIKADLFLTQIGEIRRSLFFTTLPKQVGQDRQQKLRDRREERSKYKAQAHAVKQIKIPPSPLEHLRMSTVIIEPSKAKEFQAAAKSVYSAGSSASQPSTINLLSGLVELFCSNQFAGIKHLTQKLGVKLNLEFGSEADDCTQVAKLCIIAETTEALEVALHEIRSVILTPELFKSDLEKLQVMT
jgi:hypothetical protein